jgi:hypothetical protein
MRDGISIEMIHAGEQCKRFVIPTFGISGFIFGFHRKFMQNKVVDFPNRCLLPPWYT